MILHIFNDDKFADYAIEQFSAPQMESEFALVCYGAPRLVKSEVPCYSPESPEFAAFLLTLSQYKAVVFHGLFESWLPAVFDAIPASVRIAWVFWGGEIYGRKDLQSRFLAPATKLLFFSQKCRRFFKHNAAASALELPMKYLQRVDFCLCDIQEEESFLQQYVGKPYEMRWYNYYSVQDTIGSELMAATCSGNNILVGNCSSVECNHIEALRAVKKVSAEGEVIVPLSYGESWLRNRILKIGKALLGERFRSLVDYMPREEYNKTISSCSVVVMNHWRQQAFGNILTALWLGSRVYLSKRSPLFAFFKRIGCVLFSVEDDLLPGRFSQSPLSDAEREQNRQAILAIYSKDVMHQKNLELVAELNS